MRRFDTFKEDNFDALITFANNVKTLGNNGYLMRNVLMAKLTVNFELKWGKHIHYLEEPNLVDFSSGSKMWVVLSTIMKENKLFWL